MSDSQLAESAKELTALIPPQEDGEKFALFITKFKSFLSQLEKEDKLSGQKALAQIEKTLDAPIYQDVGKILRSFHDQLSHFKEDLPSSLATLDAAGVSDNLEHILSLTDKAANKTLDLAEGLADNLADKSPIYKDITANLTSILADENLSEEAKKSLHSSIDSIGQLEATNEEAQSSITEILIAQDYQDLTGQLIQKVLAIIRDLEEDLSGLIVHYGHQFHADKTAGAVPLEGPLKNTDQSRQDQGDVDSLLSQFGF